MSYFTEPRLSACIVVTGEGRKALRTVQCFQEATIALELHVVDNAPGGHLGESLVWQCPGALYYPQRKDLGIGGAHNVVIPNLRSEYHLLCAPDVTFGMRLLEYMVQYMDANPNCLILTTRQVDQDEQELPLSYSVPALTALLSKRHGTAAMDTKADPFQVDAAPLSFMMVRTKALQGLSGLDPQFRREHADVDLCRRAAGYGVTVCHPGMQVTRHGDKPDQTSLADTMRYFAKWGLSKPAPRRE